MFMSEKSGLFVHQNWFIVNPILSMGKFGKIVILSRNLTPRLIEYQEFSGGFHFFCFRLEEPFLGKLGVKFQNFKI